MDKDFEEWKEWFDSHKDENGIIDLSKHPDLVNYLTRTLGLNTKRIRPEDFSNIGQTINFHIPIGANMDEEIQSSEIPQDGCPCTNNCCDNPCVDHEDSYSDCGNCFTCCHCNS